ncbi:MAG TPA: hypothetical protein VMT21_06070 [Gemmatimonadales bacterium]|nr:hypothetical protein [Gemmatimonadales bacterium]
MRLVAALALGLVAGPALAQQPPRAQAESSYCNVQIDSSHGQSQYVKAPNGLYETFAGGGMWAHCTNQPTTTMYSDSVAWYPERNLLFLVGHVHFQDTASVLDADRVTYYLRQERLYAEGRVYTKNLHSGSDLRGPNLDYYRAAPPLRDTLELYANGRPTIHFHSARRDSAPPAAPTDTEAFVVVADRTHMRGNDQMWGGGHVTVDRSDLAARGDSAQLDLGHNEGALIGGTPVVDGTGKDAYHLTGRYIRFALTTSHDIKQVVSEGDAFARGPDWRLAADTLDMALDSGKVQRAQAWGKHRRPDAVSGTHTIVADSLDIHMPAQIVRLVWAWGHARTTSRDTTARDTTAVRAAAARDTAAHDTTAARGPTLFRADEDWLTGDSLRAEFGVVTDSSGAKKSELDHLTAYGLARALYHVSNDDHPEQSKGVNYARAQRIDIAMKQSKVSTVDFVGKTDGVYLEPLPPPKPDSAAADSLRRAGADTTHAAAPDTTRRPPAPADTTRPRPSRP